MSRSPLRPATAPYTNKIPSECPHCGSHSVTRKGVRQKKLEIVQLWHCASCKRKFTPGPAPLRNKTYPLRTVLKALTLYNLGYSLPETAKRLKSKAGRAISPSTIAIWIDAHQQETTFRRLRTEATMIYPPEQTIRSIKLYHRQIYAYAYHRSKLALLRRNPQHQRFEALATFLENIPSSCPHELVRREDDPKARASQAHPAFADINRLIVSRKERGHADRRAHHFRGGQQPVAARDLAKFHAREQLEHRRNRNSHLAHRRRDQRTRNTIRHRARATGWNNAAQHHGPLDFLQVRNDAVHVLDYKPDARTNKPIAQLAIYALALTVRVPGLKLFDIKCAWFNEDEYNEFFRARFSRSIIKAPGKRA